MASGGAYLGSVGHFDHSKEIFSSYTDRMQMFFVANSIESPEKKKAIFLTEIGAEVYNVLANLLAPNKPRDKSLAEIEKCLNEHYNPAP